jgi:hypothetical protein
MSAASIVALALAPVMGPCRAAWGYGPGAVADFLAAYTTQTVHMIVAIIQTPGAIATGPSVATILRLKVNLGLPGAPVNEVPL